MIMKEIVNGEEVFAVEHSKTTFACGSCMFDGRGGDCSKIKCTSLEREGKAGVYFRPAYELKTLAAYHAQKHSDVQ